MKRLSLLGSLFASAVFSTSARASTPPVGYKLYVGSIPSDDIIFVKGGTYLLPCFSRYGCENDYYFGGSVKSVGVGIVRTDKGGYFCSKSILPKGMTRVQCTAKGFIIKKPYYPRGNP